MNYVYLLRCADGSLYCGWTTDLEARVKAHNTGQGARYTRSRLPAELVYSEEYEDRHEALSREWHIKRMSHAEKERMVAEAQGASEPEIVRDAIAYIRTLFEGNSDGHDFDHSMRVYRTAMLIAETEPECNRLIVALAALLHDVDDSKLFNTKDNANARKFLDSHGIGQSMTDEICFAVNSVSFSKNRGKSPETLETMIVQDADRLDAIGAVGIARTFAYGGKHSRSLDSSIRHFYDKLLQLKALMNTEKAKEMAENRHAFMKDFLDEWEKETEKG